MLGFDAYFYRLIFYNWKALAQNTPKQHIAFRVLNYFMCTIFCPFGIYYLLVLFQSECSSTEQLYQGFKY